MGEETVDLAALAVVRGNRFHGGRIRHRQIAKAAQPGEARVNGLAVKLCRCFGPDYISVIELEVLGDFEVAIAPTEFRVGRGVQGAAVR